MPLLTMGDVADELQCSKDTVRRYARDGKIEFLRIGSRLRFEPAAIEAFKEAQKGARHRLSGVNVRTR